MAEGWWVQRCGWVTCWPVLVLEVKDNGCLRSYLCQLSTHLCPLLFFSVLLRGSVIVLLCLEILSSISFLVFPNPVIQGSQLGLPVVDV